MVINITIITFKHHDAKDRQLCFKKAEDERFLYIYFFFVVVPLTQFQCGRTVVLVLFQWGPFIV